MDRGRQVAAIFDLDRTLTRRDTYLAFLFSTLQRRPTRFISSMRLPIAVLAHWAHVRDNTWLKERFLAAILGGATSEQIDSWSDAFVARVLHSGLRNQARKVIESHRQVGHRLIMATASFDFYVEKLAEQLGFDAVISTRPVWDSQGRISGKLESANCYGAAKVERLIAHFGAARADWHIVAYTDDYSDLPMLEWADYAVTVNPTARLRAIARDRQYEIQDWEDFHLGA
jgi:HAD superfamily hydrolase (TIGR01490 family)